MPDAECRSVSAYFVSDLEVVMFELTMAAEGNVSIKREARFVLVDEWTFRPQEQRLTNRKARKTTSRKTP